MTAPAVIGWDVETELIEPGNLTPRLVVATFSGGAETLDLLPPNPALHEAVTQTTWEDNDPLLGACTGWKLALKGDAIFDFMLTLVNAMVDGQVDVLVAHNGSFDWGVLCNEYPDLLPVLTTLIEQGRIADTMVREQLICIAEDNFVFDQRRKTKTRFGLDYLVMTYFNVNISESKKNPNSWRLRYGELMDVPLNEWPSAALEYAMEDAVWARLVYLEQARPRQVLAGPIVDEDGRVTNETEQTAAAWALHLMACHGVYTEQAKVREFEAFVTRVSEEAHKAAIEAGFWKVNKCKNCEGTGLTDGKTCSYCLGEDHETAVRNGRYKYRGKTPHKPGKHMKRLYALVDAAYHGHADRTDSGRVKTDADTLAGSGHPALMKFAEGAFAQKLKDTYLPILWRGVHTPITSSPNVLVRSGRTSWRNPNFQNPPQKGGFRDCFIPRDGKVFASIDYSGLEMTTLAQVCLLLFGHSKMAEAINAGKDLHTLFAGYMLQKEGYHKTYEEWNAIRKDSTHELYSLIKDRRQRAKAINFGCPGGLGVAALVEYAKGYGVNMSFNEAEDLRSTWFEMWPEMRDYFDYISDLANGPSGRYTIKQVGSNRIRGGCSYTSGANTYFQGLAADGAKAAMWALYKACYLGELPEYMAGEECHLTGVRMWAFIHDEFLFEGDETTAHLWAPQASRIMVEEMKCYTPDVAQAAPPALMRRWLKNADEKYNESGDLVPWEESK